MPNHKIITEGPLEKFAKKLEKDGKKTSSGKKPTELVQSADKFCREHAGLSEKDGGEFYQCKIGIMKKWLGMKTSGAVSKNEATDLIGSKLVGIDNEDLMS